MLFNIISYYIMSQVSDSSASDWQGWFTLKNSSTFCRVKADFILFGCRVGNLSLSWNIWLNNTVAPWTLPAQSPGTTRLAQGSSPSPALSQPQPCPLCSSTVLCGSPSCNFKVSSCPGQYLDNFFSFWIQAFMLLQNIPFVKSWDKRLC